LKIYNPCMTLNAAEIARRDAGKIVIRPSGVRVRWELTDINTSDGQSVRAIFSAAVRPLEGAADRKMLEEAFFGSATAVTAADVATHFRGALDSAARRAADSSELPALLSEAGRTALANKLAEAARGVAFGCGLELLPPFELELDSPSLRRTQEEARRSASQTERFSRAAALFKKFQEIRQSAPDLTADQIFQRIGGVDPTEQAESLRLLLLTSAGEVATGSLWAVAGPHLIKIDQPVSEGAPPRSQIFTPPPLLGPLRSVQRGIVDGKAVLLVGARSGVLVIDPQAPNEAAVYADASITSALGFNAVAATGGKIWATHGEAGLVGWDVETRDQPAAAIRPSGFSPRNLCAAGENRLIFSSGHRLFEAGGDGALREAEAEGNADILAIIREPGGSLLTIHEDGQLVRRESEKLRPVNRARRTGRITAAAGLPWLGSIRLLLATEQGPLHCVGMEDELVTQFLSPHSGLRLAAAAADRVAAVSADRQRIVIWPSWDGRTPTAEIHVSAIARHRVADVEFAF
jgi:hypothetical protein